MAETSRRGSRSPWESASLARRGSLMDRLDPRARILVTVPFIAMAVIANHLTTLGAACGLALLACLLSGLSLGAVLRRLVPINAVMLLLVLLLPWTMGRTPLVAIGPLAYTREGLHLAALIALKGNAILATLIAVVGTLEITVLGHALAHFHVPEKLVHLLLFTVRYLEVLHREYARMRAAMKVRAFRPGMNRHTYATYGSLVGMLLVRSLDRSERILAAMKCRGFRGRFYLLDHFAFSHRDGWLILASALLVGTLAAVEWL